MNSGVERQYRRIVRWYPLDWRLKNTEVMLDTLISVSGRENQRSLTIREQAAIATLGLLAHLDRLVRPKLRDLASTATLAIGAGVCAGIVLISSWAPGGAGSFNPDNARFGSFYDLSIVTALPWFFGLLLAITGQWRIGQILLLISIPLDCALPHVAAALHPVSTDRNTLVFLAASAAIASLGSPNRHWALMPAAIGTGMITLVGYTVRSAHPDFAWQDSSALWNNIAILWYAAAAAVVVAIIAATARLWTAAAAITLSLAPITLTFLIGELRSTLHQNGSAGLIAAPVTVGVLIIVMASSGWLRVLADHRILPRAVRDRSRVTTTSPSESR